MIIAFQGWLQSAPGSVCHGFHLPPRAPLPLPLSLRAGPEAQRTEEEATTFTWSDVCTLPPCCSPKGPRKAPTSHVLAGHFPLWSAAAQTGAQSVQDPR